MWICAQYRTVLYCTVMVKMLYHMHGAAMHRVILCAVIWVIYITVQNADLNMKVQ